MLSSELIRKALQRIEMNADAKIAALEKRIQTLEAELASLTVPKQEETMPMMTEAELQAWAKDAAAKITHITEIDTCSKCDRTMSNNIPTGQWKYTVTCGKCGHKEEKSRF
jgi:Zn finger protein HypA/HybF involved in hydrogenase expression